MPVSEKSKANLLPPFSANRLPPKRKPSGPYLLPLLKKFLNKKINFEDPETQRIIKGRVKDAIIWRLILNATQGEHQAIKEILDRIDGKVAEVIKTSSVDEALLSEDIEFTGVPKEGDGNGRFKRFYN